jgi:hypothetical protein
MLEVSLIEVGSSTDFMESIVIVVDTAVKTVRIFMASHKVLFNTFAAGMGVAEFADNLLSNYIGITLSAYYAGFGFNNNIWKFLFRRGFGRHGYLFLWADVSSIFIMDSVMMILSNE